MQLLSVVDNLTSLLREKFINVFSLDLVSDAVEMKK